MFLESQRIPPPSKPTRLTDFTDLVTSNPPRAPTPHRTEEGGCVFRARSKHRSPGRSWDEGSRRWIHSRPAFAPETSW